MVKLRDNRTETENGDDGERLSSLDAARGLFLLLCIGGGFGLRDPNLVNQERWGWLTNQLAHRPGDGCTLWDLLQPAFLLFVGIALPYSYANRQAKGQNWIRQFAHAIKRALLLVLVGMYLDGYRENRPLFDDPFRWLEFRGELQQIGIAYLIAFIVMPMGMIVQGMTVAFLLVGSTAGYVIYALASKNDFWHDHLHLGTAIDQWLHFAEHRDHLVTFNAVPAAAVVLLGVLVGGLIRSGLSSGVKVAIMTCCSFIMIAFGWILSGGNGWIDFSWPALIPMSRRLMTWTFVSTSVGWTLLVFTYFYLIMDGFFMRSWALPLTVLGRNPLFLFVTFTLFRAWAAQTALLLLPTLPPIVAMLRPLFVELVVIAIYWLACVWLYRRRIFFKV